MERKERRRHTPKEERRDGKDGPVRILVPTILGRLKRAISTCADDEPDIHGLAEPVHVRAGRSPLRSQVNARRTRGDA